MVREAGKRCKWYLGWIPVSMLTFYSFAFLLSMIVSIGCNRRGISGSYIEKVSTSNSVKF